MRASSRRTGSRSRAGHTRSAPALGLALLLFGVAACSDPAIPEGTPGDIQARVFVDVNATGSFVAGEDQPVAGVAVEVRTPTGDVVDSGTTDSDGVVRFSGLRPAGYELRHDGAVPEGAVLATARATSVRVPAQGGMQEVDFRYVFNPGSVSGVVFRDDTGTGSFDPEGDFPGEGARISLFRGASATGEPDLEALSDATGAFAFPQLRPGPWTMRVELPPPLELVGDPVRSFTVNPMAETRLEIVFEGDQVIDIAEARTLELGTIVTVQGVVTVDRGNFGNLDIHIQDQTGGIDLFLGGTSGVPALVAGDSIEVTGALGEFNGSLQIRSPSSLEVLGTGEVPEPRPVTGQEVEARTFEGLVATLGVVTVESIDVQNFDNHNLQVRTADGTEVQVRVDSRTGLASSDWEIGGSYEIAGILRIFQGTPRIQPRSPADRILPAEPVSIAEARAAELGTIVTVQGVVTVDRGNFGNLDIHIQDQTAGIDVFLGGTSGVPALVAGDSIEVTGALGEFNDALQISDTPSINLLGTGDVPEPRPVTGQEVEARTFEGLLATLGVVTVEEIEVQSFDNHNLQVRTADGTLVEVRVDSRTGLASSDWEIGESYEIVGILRIRNGVPRLQPRSPADRIASAEPVSIAEARAAEDNEVGQIKPRGFRDVVER